MILFVLIIITMYLTLLPSIFQCTKKKEQLNPPSPPAKAVVNTNSAKILTPEHPMYDEPYVPDLSIISEKTAKTTGNSDTKSTFKSAKHETNKHRLPGTKYKVVDGKLEERAKLVKYPTMGKGSFLSSNPLSYALAGQAKSNSQEITMEQEINQKNIAADAPNSQSSSRRREEIDDDDNVYLPADQLP